MNPTVKYLIQFAVVAISYYLSGKLSHEFGKVSESIMPVWFPSGIILGLLLNFGWKLFPSIWVGSFLLNIETFPAIPSLIIAMINSIEPLLGYFFIGKLFSFKNIFSTIKGALTFLLLGVVLSPSITSLLCSTLAFFANPIATKQPWMSLLIGWWASSSMGILLITPLFILFEKKIFLLLRKQSWKLLEIVLIYGVITLVAVLIFSKIFPYFYILFPFLILSAYRFGFRGVFAFLFTINLVAFFYFWEMLPHSMERGLNSKVLETQIFNCILAGTGLIFSAAFSERKRTFEDLQISLQSYKNLADCFPGVVLILDSEFKCTFIAGQGILGKVKYYLGKYAKEFVPEEDFNIYSPYWKRAFNGEKSSYYAKYSGKHYLTFVTPIVVQDGEVIEIMVSSHDISELRKAESALLESEERYRQMFQANSAIKLLIDPFTGQIMEVNTAATKFYGYTKEELEKLYIWDINTLPKDQIKKRLIETSKHQQYYQFQHKLKTGEIRDVEIYTGPIVAGNKIMIFSIIQDITYRKHYEAEILQLNQTLEKKIEERTSDLVSAIKELESFSYSISHDLRSPLRAIGGFSQILVEEHKDEFSEEGQNALSRIIKATEKMNDMVTALLNLSKIGRTSANKKTLNLTEIAKAIVDDLKRDYSNLEIQFTVEDSLLATADEFLLTIVLQNLFDNAIKYSSKKERVEIKFGKTIHDNTECFFIEDHGAGFDTTYADKLFSVFHRLHSNSEFEGIGIGLATVRRIIERHGGKIWADSSPGKGSVFYFTLNSK